MQTRTTAGTNGRPGARFAARLIVLLCGLPLVAILGQAPGWSVTDSLGEARLAPGGTLLPSGRVLVAGGSDVGAEVTSSEIYDPMALPGSLWSYAAPLPVHHRFHMITLTGGLVLFVGEDRGPVIMQATAHLFDETAGPQGTWMATTGLDPAIRYRATLTELPNGMVLFCGGYDGTAAGPTYDLAELYDPLTNGWLPTATLGDARLGHTAVLLQTGPDAGRVLVTGGAVRMPLQDVTTAELYDPPTGTWLPASAPLTPRGAHTATVLADGRVLVTGGYAAAAPQQPSAEIYDPVTGIWSVTGSMAAARSFHTATLLQNGRVLVTGGLANGGIGPVEDTSELYDPVTGTWSSAGSMATARSHHRAVLLPSGGVLVAGGWDTSVALASAELFVPPCGQCGDTNDDRVVSILDALAAARHAAGLTALTDCEFDRANVTGVLEPAPGAVVDTLDTLRIAQFAAGLPVALACRQ